MVAALALPRLLAAMPDRVAMRGRAGLLNAALAAAMIMVRCETLLTAWFVLGFGYSMTQTPPGGPSQGTAAALVQPRISTLLRSRPCKSKAPAA